MFSRKLTLILLLTLGLVGIPAFSQTWNAFNDFAGPVNPNGAWSYGYGTTGSSFTLYDIYALNCFGTPLNCWQPLVTVIGTPNLTWNNTGNFVNFSTAVIPPGLTQHPGPSVDAITQWTAPLTGAYTISGFFQIADVNPSGIVGLVFENGTPLFQQELLGPPAQHPNTPGGIETFYFSALMLNAGDVISFGVNNDGNFLFDTTHFNATVTAVPEPGSMVLLASGLVGVVGFLRRKLM
jgi:hypothetical protein